MNESGDADVVIYARPSHRDESNRTRIRAVPVGGDTQIGLLADGTVHIFYLEIGSDTSLSTRVDTTPAEGQSDERQLTFTVRGSSVVVTDNHAEAPYTVGEPLEQPDSARTASDIRGSAQLEVGELLCWHTRTVEDAQHASASLASNVPSLRPSLSKSNWEDELGELLEQLKEGCSIVRAQAEQENVHATPPSAGIRTYRLRDTTRQNAVLAKGTHGDAAKRGPRAVWSHPTHESPSKFLGVERNDEVQIEEAVDGWLRYKPKPRDSSQCWIKQETEDGRWETVPRDSSASLQTDFFATSGLELLLFSLNTSGDAAALLLRSTGDFAKRVPPLALFDSAGPGLDRLLGALIDWAQEKCENELSDGTTSGSSDTVAATEATLLIFVRLVVARGTLPMLIRLAEFLSRHPKVVTVTIMDEIVRLSDVRGFAEQAQLCFGPPPGSLDDLVAQCESLMRTKRTATFVYSACLLWKSIDGINVSGCGVHRD